MALPLTILAQNASVSKADRLLQQDLYEEAKMEIDAAIQDATIAERAHSWYIYGRVYSDIYLSDDPQVNALDQEALTKAILGFEKAMSIDNIGSNYYTLADLSKSNLHSGLLNQGIEAFKVNELGSARESFENASKVLPTDTLAFLYLGIVCQSLEDWTCSRTSFEQVAELGSTNATIYESIIYSYEFIEEDPTRALDWARRAVQTLPNNSTLRKRMVNLMIKTEGVAEAKAELESLIQDEPDNANLYFNLGYLNEELGDEQAAIRAYKSAIAADPNYFDAVYNLGVFYYNKAADTYDVLNNLTSSEYDQQQANLNQEAERHLRSALPLMEKAAELRPEEPIIYNTLATIYSRIGEDAKAQQAMTTYEMLMNE